MSNMVQTCNKSFLKLEFKCVEELKVEGERAKGGSAFSRENSQWQFYCDVLCNQNRSWVGLLLADRCLRVFFSIAMFQP